MLIVLLTFVLILGIVLGAYYAFVVRPERGETSRLLGRLATPKVTSQLLKPGDLERPADRLSGVQAIQAMLSRAKGFSGPIDRLITQSGLNITVGTLVMASVLLGCVGYLIVKSLTHFTLAGSSPLRRCSRAFRSCSSAGSAPGASGCSKSSSRRRSS